MNWFLRHVREFNDDRSKAGKKLVSIVRVTYIKDIAGYGDKFNKNRKLPNQPGISFIEDRISIKDQVYLIGDDVPSFHKIHKIFFNHKEDVCYAAMTDISFTMHN